MDDLIISMLQLAGQLSTGDFLVINIPDESSETGFATRKVSTNDLFIYFLTQVLFTSALDTSIKTITGAINEINTKEATLENDVDVMGQMISTLQGYADGDTITVPQAVGTLYGGDYKLFIPLPKALWPSIGASITSNVDITGAVTHTGVTLASLGIVNITTEDTGLLVEVTGTSDTAEGLVVVENIEISFAEV